MPTDDSTRDTDLKARIGALIADLLKDQSANTVTGDHAEERGALDEKFLGQVVMCKLSDRLEAMQIRQTRGIEAALEYLGTCTLTDESDAAYTDAYNKCEAGIASAKAEIRRQLEQSYALVSAVKQRLDEDDNASSIILLDMAEDVLGDHSYINRIDPPEQGGAT